MRIPNYDFHARTTVLTGAASGMGEQLAHGLAARASELVLIDRDSEGLEAVARAIHATWPGAKIQLHVVDLADADALAAVAQRILAASPRIGLLINNAGVALGGRFEQLTMADFDWIMAINFRAPVLMTHYLMPALKAGGNSHVVNVSSLFGLVAPAGQSAYAASKFALRGFSEALRAELAGDGIGVTTVHPGGVRTNIAKNARSAGTVTSEQLIRSQRQFAALLTFPADRAAALILDAVERRRPRLLIGASAKIPDLISRAAPASYPRIQKHLTRGIRLMGTLSNVRSERSPR
ncbi:MAG: SDR family NAD(P)-dependent oxidoreductase [Actinomycetales bacterium]